MMRHPRRLPGGEQSAMVKDWQVDPIKGSLLHVDLVREIPEAKKPRSIPIGAAAPSAPVIEGSKAAA